MVKSYNKNLQSDIDYGACRRFHGSYMTSDKTDEIIKDVQILVPVHSRYGYGWPALLDYGPDTASASHTIKGPVYITNPHEDEYVYANSWAVYGFYDGQKEGITDRFPDLPTSDKAKVLQGLNTRLNEARRGKTFRAIYQMYFQTSSKLPDPVEPFTQTVGPFKVDFLNFEEGDTVQYLKTRVTWKRPLSGVTFKTSITEDDVLFGVGVGLGGAYACRLTEPFPININYKLNTATAWTKNATYLTGLQISTSFYDPEIKQWYSSGLLYNLANEIGFALGDMSAMYK